LEVLVRGQLVIEQLMAEDDVELDSVLDGLEKLEVHVHRRLLTAAVGGYGGVVPLLR
jgi:hypothetical protein